MNTPIYDFLTAYAERSGVRFHMPGHKGQGMLGIEALDITEVAGADVLVESMGIIGESEKNATALFRSGRTVYSAGGATAAIGAMLALSAEEYRTAERPYILAARSAHRSFFQSAALLDIPVKWLIPKSASTVYSGVMSAEEIAQVLSTAEKKPFAIYITSPNYLGEIWDIAGIAAVCRTMDIPLLVDNAHGAYLAFLSPSLHPLHLGATMCTDSAHKTLPVLTGGAYLHIAKEHPRLMAGAKNAMALFSSTSPSYLILASLDLANRTLNENYPSALQKTVARVLAAKDALKKSGFYLVGDEPLKITIADKRAEALGSLLRENGIEPELCDREHLVLMASASNKVSDFDKLLAVLLPLGKNAARPKPSPAPSYGATALSLREALFALKETIAVKDASGRVYAEISAICPPAVPIAVCGEVITDSMVDAFLHNKIQTVAVVKQPCDAKQRG